MKNKFASFFLCFSVLFSSCAKQNLNITVENNSKNPRDPQVFYWVNNDTGAEIKNIEWSLNGVYFYTANLPIDGDHLDLFDFAKSDGTRYDYYSVKPIELKAKCKQGRYSVKFDDIPLPDTFPKPIIPTEEYTTAVREILGWHEFSAENKTSDGVSVSLAVALGYKADDKAISTELIEKKDIVSAYLHQFIAEKTAADFSPKNEKQLQLEIRNSVNDSFLTAGRIRDVRFTRLE